MVKTANNRIKGFDVTATITELVIIITVVIAIISLCVTWIFNQSQRKHNEESIKLQKKHNEDGVRPLCEIILSDYDEEIAVKIVNNGTGPMIITDCICTDKDSKNRNEDYKSGYAILYKVMSTNKQLAGKNLPWKDFTEYVNERSIPVGGKVVLIAFGHISDSNLKERIRDVLSKITIRVYYEDVYKNRMPMKERELSFFNRPAHDEKGNYRHVHKEGYSNTHK